jgi:hypothetical protein
LLHDILFVMLGLVLPLCHFQFLLSVLPSTAIGMSFVVVVGFYHRAS